MKRPDKVLVNGSEYEYEINRHSGCSTFEIQGKFMEKPIKDRVFHDIDEMFIRGYIQGYEEGDKKGFKQGRDNKASEIKKILWEDL